MTEPFDQDAAKKFLLDREAKEKALNEQIRNEVLERAISVLKEEFEASDVEVYLVGSLIRPHAFTKNSDVDIVLKNFSGDRFEIWTKLEEEIGRDVEVILFESCSFKEFVESDGMKVV